MTNSAKVPEHQKRRSKIITKNVEKSRQESEKELERARVLLRDSEGGIQVENDLERTWKAKQSDILEQADDNTKAKVLDLKLSQAYDIRFTRNGRFMVMGSDRGHLAVVDALRSHVKVEVNLENDIVHAVTPLHNETLFAAAQNKYLYVYDHAGTEVHQFRSHIEPRRVEFLPYHFLLATVGRSSRVVYQDISTGEMVASLRSRMGACSVLTQNPKTAVLATGHANGVVAMWAPTNGDALLKVLCHPSPVTAVAFDRSGTNMVTGGMDGRVLVWDVRNLGSWVNAYTTRAPRFPTNIAISDTGLVAVSTSGDEVTIWKDILKEDKQKDPYLNFHLASGTTAKSLAFRPFEDILGIGYTHGVKTIIVPGAGEPNFDAFEANPFERKMQRREAEVRALLDKLPADTIGLDTIGAVQTTGVEKGDAYLNTLIKRAKKHKKIKQSEETKTSADGSEVDGGESFVLGDKQEQKRPEKEVKEKQKTKGRGRIGKRLKVKHRNIITVEREKRKMEIDAKREEQNKKKRVATASGTSLSGDGDKPGQTALQRFMKKPKRS